MSNDDKTPVNNDNVMLTLLQHRMDRMEKDLYGNGQPGEFCKIKEEISALRRTITKTTVAVAVLAAGAGGGLVRFFDFLF